MSREIRQGCRISSLLYLFVFSLKINDNGVVNSFKSTSMDRDIKNIHPLRTILDENVLKDIH